MTTKTKKLGLLVIALIFTFTISSVLALDFNIDNALPSSVINKEVKIETDSITSQKVEVAVDGEIKNWIKLEQYKGLTFNNQAPLIIQVPIHIPEDVEERTYTGTMYIKIKGSKSLINSMEDDIKRVNFKINIVTQEIKTIEVNEIKITNSEENSPTNIYLEIENTGNVPSKPILETIINEKLTSQELEELTPLETKEINLPLNAELKEGQHKAVITIRLDEKQIHQEEIGFKIAKEGTFIKRGQILSITDNEYYLPNESTTITAKFKNTGEIPLWVNLEGEIINNNIVEKFETEPVYITVNEIKDLTYNYSHKGIGEYYIFAIAKYSNTATEEVHGTFYVVEQDPDAIPMAMNPITITVIALVGLIMIHFILKKRIQENE